MYSFVEKSVNKCDLEVTLCVVKNVNLERSVPICIDLTKFVQAIENEAGLGCARKSREGAGENKVAHGAWELTWRKTRFLPDREIVIDRSRFAARVYLSRDCIVVESLLGAYPRNGDLAGSVGQIEKGPTAEQ